MYTPVRGIPVILVQTLFTFFLSWAVVVTATDETVLEDLGGGIKGYVKGDLVPVSCLNRTMYAPLMVLSACVSWLIMPDQ